MRAIRTGAERIHENRLIALADAALRELTAPEPTTMENNDNIPTDAQTVRCMQQYGGSFVKRLAECWLAADVLNQARLKAAFPEVFERYREHAARAAKGPAHYLDMATQAQALAAGGTADAGGQ